MSEYKSDILTKPALSQVTNDIKGHISLKAGQTIPFTNNFVSFYIAFNHRFFLSLLLLRKSSELYKIVIFSVSIP